MSRRRVVTASSYFSTAFYAPDRDGAIEHVRQAKERLGFDTVVVTGVSGCLMGGLIAHVLDLNLLVVRKPDDHSTHSYRRIEGDLGEAWAFLDDFIDTGATRKRIRREVREYAEQRGHSTRFVGTVGYQHGDLFNGNNRRI